MSKYKINGSIRDIVKDIESNVPRENKNDKLLHKGDYTEVVILFSSLLDNIANACIANNEEYDIYLKLIDENISNIKNKVTSNHYLNKHNINLDKYLDFIIPNNREAHDTLIEFKNNIIDGLRDSSLEPNYIMELLKLDSYAKGYIVKEDIHSEILNKYSVLKEDKKVENKFSNIYKYIEYGVLGLGICVMGTLIYKKFIK